MLFPHNEDPKNNDPAPSSTDWQAWLEPAADPAAAPVPEQIDADTTDPVGHNGGDVHVPTAEGPDWSAWISDSAPTTPAVGAAAPVAGAGEKKTKRGKGPLIGVFVGGVVAAAAVAAGVVVLVSDPTAPEIPIPASTPSSVAIATPPPAVDATLGGGPGCAPTRQPTLVRGNGTGSTKSGPDVILAFQHAYYTTRSGVAARKMTTPDADVSAVEVIDAGIATIPVDTRYCITVTPTAQPDQFTVLIAEVRPDSTVRSYQQLVTVAVIGTETLITRIGAVE
ncbi:hypothetical protein [Nocardia salmonicida]|uniref:hypothetical protein n=1 Tax=Nocardia salmonicida TaxID=53431 RepID=UPI0033F068CB